MQSMRLQRSEKELLIIQSELPEGLVANIGYDSTVYIEESIEEVVHTLIETLLIVILVIYLFMGASAQSWCQS